MRSIIYTAAALAPVNRFARWLRRSQLLVLCYHGVCSGSSANLPDYDGLHTPVALFGEHLDFLARHFDFVSLEDATKAWTAGASLPPRPVLLTFDDGYRNVVRNAWPVLKEKKIPSALFVVPKAIDSKDWLWPQKLSWRFPDRAQRAAQVKKLSGQTIAERERVVNAETAGAPISDDSDFSLAGWQELKTASEHLASIGSHSDFHSDLSRCTPEDLRSELVDSRARIESMLGGNCISIAFPFGGYSETVCNEAQKNGYEGAFTTEPRYARASDSALTIPRILVGREDTIRRFEGRISGWQDWLNA